VVLAVLSVVATIVAGPAAWSDFFTLLRQVSNPIETERNLTPGAVLYQLGMAPDLAAWVQLASTVAVVALFLVAATRSTAEASYLVAVVASQLLSPILWDHYAMLLLLPVAYLLSAGVRWAVLIPLVTAVPLIGVTPPIAYPIAFYVTLVATLVVGLRRAGPGQAEPPRRPEASFA
jgi:hypothetical protein